MARIEEALKKNRLGSESSQPKQEKATSLKLIKCMLRSKTIANMGSVPNTVLLQNNANKILNTIMNSKPQVLDNRMLEQGMYADVQFFVDELKNPNMTNPM